MTVELGLTQDAL